MDDKTISRICLAVTIFGILLFALTYEEEFTKKSIAQINSKEGEKGIVFGRIDYVIKSYPVTLFILTDGNKATIYYPKATTLKTNDFVTVYIENKIEELDEPKTNTLFAHKVVKE
jgi:hypothetical protein